MKMLKNENYEYMVRRSLYYNIDRDVVEIRKYLGNEKEVVVPSEIDGIPVEDIDGAFRNSDIEKVTLSEGIKKIGYTVFKDCYNLKEVVLPNSLISISDKAFENCNFEHITLNEGLKDIRREAFNNCKNLKSITFPKSLYIVNDKAFQNCTSLESVTNLAEDLSYGYYSFNGCEKLYGDSDYIVLNNELVSYREGLEIINVPDGVTKIRMCCIGDFDAVKEVYMTDSVVEIDTGVFGDCVNLKKVNLSKNLETIGFHTFKNCTSLEEITLPKSLKTLSDKCFMNCSKLEKVIIPASVTSILSQAFDKCKNLELVEFEHSPEELKKVKILKKAFPCNPNMKNITDTLINSWSTADSDKYRLNQLLNFNNLEDNEKGELTKVLKSKKTLRNLIFKKGSIEHMNSYFNLGFTLKLDELEEHLQNSIKAETTEVTTILLNHKENNIPKSEVEKYEENKELVEIGLELPTIKQLKEKWNVVDRREFFMLKGYKGNNIMEVIPATVKTGKPIKCVPYSLFSAFLSSNYMSSLNGITNIPTEFKPLRRIVLSNGEEINLTNFCDENVHELKEDDFPYILEILGGMFCGCTTLEKVALPDTIRSIYNDAFNNCINLKEVKLPKELTSIKEAGFCHCVKLEKIEFPESLRFIDTCAFQDCHALEEVTLPKSLEKLEKWVFLMCKNLKKVYLPDTLTDIHELAFEGCYSLDFVGYADGRNILGSFV